jgi:hypothetical protein
VNIQFIAAVEDNRGLFFTLYVNTAQTTKGKTLIKFDDNQYVTDSDGSIKTAEGFVYIDGKKYLAHTLNNTVVASPRMLIAFLENNLQADGSVKIPVALRPYMGGMEVMMPKH